MEIVVDRQHALGRGLGGILVRIRRMDVDYLWDVAVAVDRRPRPGRMEERGRA